MLEQERAAHRRLGSSLAALFALLAVGCGSPSQPLHVVLVVLDTTRADRLSVYGYDKETTPRLAALARESIVFERAYATSPWTVSSHASLFTGLLPLSHRATQENLYLDEELDTLAELLRERGYRSAAFSNNSWVSRLTNLTQGFDEVFAMWREGEQSSGALHPTNQAIRAWLAGRLPEVPLFLFVNFIEPHWPYRAPREFQDRFVDPRVPERARRRSSFTAIRWYSQPEPQRPGPRVLELRSRLYDAEIAHVDAVVGELVDLLRELELLDSSLLIVTSDHGENLGEKGHQGHSFALYGPTLRVPLLIRPPGGGGGVRRDPVQLPDVFATIAAAAGIAPADPRVVGRDLLAGPVPDSRPILAEYYYPQMFLKRFPKSEAVDERLTRFKRRIRSIQIGDQKLIWGSDGHHELYDLAADPGEQENLLEKSPETAQRLEQELERLRNELEREPLKTRSPLDAIDRETEANLRALGYLP